MGRTIYLGEGPSVGIVRTIEYGDCLESEIV